MSIPGRPPRLTRILVRESSPIFFITFGTWNRIPVLANQEVHISFKGYASDAHFFGVKVGRYVIMPDHFHLLIQFVGGIKLGPWIKGLKVALGKAVVPRPKKLWQPGFFDHLVRSDESLGEKWEYLRMNPVRAGLCDDPDDWPYAGEIENW